MTEPAMTTPNTAPADAASGRAFWLIWMAVFIEMLGVGIIIPVMPSLLKDLTGLDANQSASWGGILTFTFFAVQFIMSPILGALSDQFGRRPVILVSLGTYSIDFALMAFAPALWMLFIGRAISGGCAATYATASAAIADITPTDKKAARYGMMGAAFGIGFIVGPVIGGHLAQLDGVVFDLSGARLPFLVASALAALNAGIAFFLLPETLRGDKRRRFNPARANPVGSLWAMRAYPAVLGLMGALFLMQIAHASLPAIWTYYATHRYGWDEVQTGYVLGFVGVVVAIFQAGLVGFAVKKLGPMRAIVLALTAMTVEFFIFAMAGVGWLIYAGVIIGGMGAFAMPAMQTRMTSQLPDNAQGELQGAVASIMAITMIIGTLVFTQTFTAFSADDAVVYFPGAAFLLASVCTFAAGIVVVLTGRTSRTGRTGRPGGPGGTEQTDQTPDR